MMLDLMVGVALDKEKKSNNEMTTDMTLIITMMNLLVLAPVLELILHLKGCMMMTMMMIMTQQLLLEQILTRRVFESDANTSLLHTNFVHQ